MRHAKVIVNDKGHLEIGVHRHEVARGWISGYAIAAFRTARPGWQNRCLAKTTSSSVGRACGDGGIPAKLARTKTGRAEIVRASSRGRANNGRNYTCDAA